MDVDKLHQAPGVEFLGDKYALVTAQQLPQPEPTLREQPQKRLLEVAGQCPPYSETKTEKWNTWNIKGGDTTFFTFAQSSMTLLRTVTASGVATGQLTVQTLCSSYDWMLYNGGDFHILLENFFGGILRDIKLAYFEAPPLYKCHLSSQLWTLTITDPWYANNYDTIDMIQSRLTVDLSFWKKC